MKFRIYGMMTASKYFGTIEAKSKEEAEDIAYGDEKIAEKWYVSLCSQCAHEVELSDIHGIQVEEE